MRAARRAELPRHRVRDVAATKLLRRSLGVREARLGHADDDVRVTARDVPTLPAVTLAREERVALRLVAHRAAIASAFEVHAGFSSLPHDRPSTAQFQLAILDQSTTQAVLRGAT